MPSGLQARGRQSAQRLVEHCARDPGGTVNARTATDFGHEEKGVCGRSALPLERGGPHNISMKDGLPVTLTPGTAGSARARNRHDLPQSTVCCEVRDVVSVYQ